MLHINVQQQLGRLTLRADLQLPTQGVTAIFGLSGSGKTSLINLVSGLTHPDQGFIRLNDRTLVDVENGENLPVHQRKIGYVFQDARLFPHYNVKGNLRYGMKNVSREDFDYIVQLLGIEPLLKRYPLTLSGGEKQRVAIGRALLTDPDILLMDEPLSALDVPRKRELMQYLESLSKEINVPILYVTHSLDELLRLAERVVLMENGKVKAYDTLENVWNSPLFAPWKGESEQSSVLALPVYLHNPTYKMTALSLGLALASGFASADENIAFINAGYLFQNHPDRQAVADKLDAEFKPMADKLAASKKEIDDKIVASRKKVEAKIAALQKDAPRLRQAEIQKRQDEITKFGSDEEAALNKLMEEQDKKVAEFQELNEKRQTEERGKLLESIQVATNNLAKAKGYTYVLDANSVVFAVDGKDITEEVLKSIPATEKAAPAKTEEKK